MYEPCILLSSPVDMGRGDTLGFECLLLSSVSQSRLDPTPVTSLSPPEGQPTSS